MNLSPEGQFWVISNDFQKEKFLEKLDELTSKKKKVFVTFHTSENRSAQQNKAMHVYFAALSSALNDSGRTMADVFGEKIEGISWTPAMVKDAIWKPIMQKATGKDSTRSLTKAEVTEVYEILNQFMSNNFGIGIEWPSRFEQ